MMTVHCRGIIINGFYISLTAVMARERCEVLIQTFSSIIPHNKASDYATDYLLYQDRTSQHSPIRHATIGGRAKFAMEIENI